MDGGGDVGIGREKVVCGGGIGREREMGDEKERKRERKKERDSYSGSEFTVG